MLALLTAAALAAEPTGPAVPPPHTLTRWEEPLRVAAGGTRVGMIVETTDSRAVRVQVWQGTRWVPARETFREGRVAVLVADLGVHVAEVRLRSPDQARITRVDWDLLVPLGEARAEGAAPPAPGVLPAELSAIGVVSRSSWGARATTCSTTEDDWYRMAIHHTAGSQTSGGTVQGSVKALQAYAMDSGEYCDIPYQFLVGYDGSLWEGRPYDYYSGATGGGNNDGNIAVCFLGCYHGSGCSTSHSVTDAMMDSGQLLVQTLAALHSIPSDSNSIRGHRDWPDNATACPGDYLYARLDELREPLGPSYAGSLVEASFGSLIELEEGARQTLTLRLLNTGKEDWSPNATNLGTLPRDQASPLAAAGWLSTTRPATVSATTAPGEVGTFTFEVLAPAAGDYALSLALVQEWVTWFPDDGGPAEGALATTVRVSAPPADSPALGEDSDPNDHPGPGEGGGDAVPPPGQTTLRSELGLCATPPTPGAGLLALAGLTLLRRRTSR